MTPTPRIRVLAADDHALIRDGIGMAVRSQPDMELVAEAENGRQAVEMFRQYQPDVTLMDLQMPLLNGIDAMIEIRRFAPAARIVVLTTYSGDFQAARALESGAAGYLLKGALRKELLQAIRDVHAGQRRIQSEVALDLANYIASDRLSPREIMVLRKVSEGLSNKQVAGELQITEDTVKAHLKSIMGKLEARDRTHAVSIATRRGFLDG